MSRSRPCRLDGGAGFISQARYLSRSCISFVKKSTQNCNSIEAWNVEENKCLFQELLLPDCDSIIKLSESGLVAVSVVYDHLYLHRVDLSSRRTKRTLRLDEGDTQIGLAPITTHNPNEAPLMIKEVYLNKDGSQIIIQDETNVYQCLVQQKSAVYVPDLSISRVFSALQLSTLNFCLSADFTRLAACEGGSLKVWDVSLSGEDMSQRLLTTFESGHKYTDLLELETREDATVVHCIARHRYQEEYIGISIDSNRRRSVSRMTLPGKSRSLHVDSRLNALFIITDKCVTTWDLETDTRVHAQHALVRGENASWLGHISMRRIGIPSLVIQRHPHQFQVREVTAPNQDRLLTLTMMLHPRLGSRSPCSHHRNRMPKEVWINVARFLCSFHHQPFSL